MMNPTKFGSPHLDTPSSRYNFCNLATKSVKIYKENKIHSGSATGYTRSIHPTVTNVWAPKVNQPHMSVRTRQGVGFDRRELTVDEVTGDEVTTDVFPPRFTPSELSG